jgi:hypothetical protein
MKLHSAECHSSDCRGATKKVLARDKPSSLLFRPQQRKKFYNFDTRIANQSMETGTNVIKLPWAVNNTTKPIS